MPCNNAAGSNDMTERIENHRFEDIFWRVVRSIVYPCVYPAACCASLLLLLFILQVQAPETTTYHRIINAVWILMMITGLQTYIYTLFIKKYCATSTVMPILSVPGQNLNHNSLRFRRRDTLVCQNLTQGAQENWRPTHLCGTTQKYSIMSFFLSPDMGYRTCILPEQFTWPT